MFDFVLRDIFGRHVSAGALWCRAMNPTTAPAMPDYAAPSTLAPDRRLTAEQVQFFKTHGYLAIDAIMSPDEIERVKRIYDELFADSSGRTAPDKYNLAGGKKPTLPQILTPSKYAPDLLQTQMVANLKAMVRQLLGDAAYMTGDHAINKPPHSGAPTPWHQDEAYWNPAKEYEALSVWIPLQPATRQNGCMYFVPGSHRLEVVEHRPIGGDPTVVGLEVAPGAADLNTAVACELPPGGATFHYSRTFHYTPPNTSNDYRRAYIASASLPEKVRAVPRVFPWQERQRAAKATAASRLG